jgi:hypothetical protein
MRTVTTLWPSMTPLPPKSFRRRLGRWLRTRTWTRRFENADGWRDTAFEVSVSKQGDDLYRVEVVMTCVDGKPITGFAPWLEFDQLLRASDDPAVIEERTRVRAALAR